LTKALATSNEAKCRKRYILLPQNLTFIMGALAIKRRYYPSAYDYRRFELSRMWN
jgi:hypothetical protein